MGFLRQLFGPSKREIWKQFAAELGADYVAGGFLKTAKVQAHYEQWTIALDTFAESDGENSTTYTRIRAPYVNRDGLQFKLYRKGLFSKIGEWLGMHDIEIGDPEFDEAFIIKGSDQEQLRALFADVKIRQLIAAQPSIFLTVKSAGKFPEGVDKLHFQAVGVIKDVERLKAIFALFGKLLDQLCRIGSAYETQPGITV